MIPQNYIDALLDKTNIVDLLRQSLTLTKKGDNYWACCPFHNEKTPSFSVSEKKQFYYCFGCKRAGHALRFLMDHNQQPFPEAIQTLAEFTGFPLPEDLKNDQHQNKDSYHLLEKVTQCYESALKNNNTAISYLKSRALTGKIAKQYRLGFAPATWDHLTKKCHQDKPLLLDNGLLIKHEQGRLYDRFRNRIIFPVRDVKGRIAAFGGRIINQDEPKYINSPESAIFHKKRTIYGLYEALQTASEKTLSEITVVEGYMDVISLAQLGYSNAVACMGTALSEQHLTLFRRYTKKIIFCFDGDQAGKIAAFKTVELLLKMQLTELTYHFIFLPEKTDPDSFIRQEGLDAFKILLKNALSFDNTIIRYLTHQYDTNTLIGRSQAVEQAKKIVAQIPNTALGALIIEKLSLICQMPSEKLQSLCNTPNHSAPKRTTPSQAPKNLWHKTIAYLIAQPKLAYSVSDATFLEFSVQKEANDLSKLIATVKKLSVDNTRQLIDQIHNEPLFQAYLKLATWQSTLSEKQIEIEFTNCMQQIERNLNQEKINQLIRTSKTVGLNESEKEILQKLIYDQKINSRPEFTLFDEK